MIPGIQEGPWKFLESSGGQETSLHSWQKKNQKEYLCPQCALPPSMWWFQSLLGPPKVFWDTTPQNSEILIASQLKLTEFYSSGTVLGHYQHNLTLSHQPATAMLWSAGTRWPALASAHGFSVPAGSGCASLHLKWWGSLLVLCACHADWLSYHKRQVHQNHQHNRRLRHSTSAAECSVEGTCTGTRCCCTCV